MDGLSILIVDDDEDFADGLMELLELEGHQPLMVHSGRQAIAAVESGSFDVALLDIGLPDMNGAECYREIRRMRPGLPCILMTGYSVEDIASQGIDSDSFQILTKPVDPEDLNQRLAAI